jgi:hypothetical protein
MDPDPDADPDPAIFVSGLQHVKFIAYYFLKVHHFSQIKSHKEAKKQ